jgi:hypothetical protein
MMMKLWDQTWHRQELLERVGDIEQLMGIKLMEMSDGPERGNRAMDVRSGGGLRYSINADRGLDISHLEYKGIPLAWRSSVGDASPAFYAPMGNDWLRNFPGGIMVTGGLSHYGRPCIDDNIEFGLHGRASNLPARKVSCLEQWDADNYHMSVSGMLRESAVYGENLRLFRTITTIGGTNTIEISDEVVNDGFTAVPHMILYHFNLGFPLITPESTVKISAAESEVYKDGNGRGLEQWNTFFHPELHAEEDLYYHRMNQGNEYSHCEIIHPTLLFGKPLAVKISFRTRELGHLFNWKMLKQGINVFGVEPSNCKGLEGRKKTKESGIPILEPGEKVAYSVIFKIEEL